MALFVSNYVYPSTVTITRGPIIQSGSGNSVLSDEHLWAKNTIAAACGHHTYTNYKQLIETYPNYKLAIETMAGKYWSAGADFIAITPSGAIDASRIGVFTHSSGYPALKISGIEECAKLFAAGKTEEAYDLYWARYRLSNYIEQIKTGIRLIPENNQRQLLETRAREHGTTNLPDWW